MKLPVGPRPIQTVFYSHSEQVIRVNSSATAFNAVPNAIKHMQNNEYEAWSAEVFNNRTGKLHAVIIRHVSGDIEILFKAKPIAGE